MCEPITLAALATAATSYGAIGAGAVAATSTTAAVAGLTAMQAIALGATVGGTVLSATSAYQQSQVSKQIASNNAQTAEYQAQEAQRLGEKQAIEVQRKGAAMKSAQRVGLAAKGLDLGYGTAADLQDQTDFFTQSDVATTRTNAAKDAWGKRAQGANYRGQANAENPLMMAGGSLLSGAAQVSDKWNMYKGR